MANEIEEAERDDEARRDEARTIPVRRIGDEARSARRLVVVAGVALALFILKPWGGLPPPPDPFAFRGADDATEPAPPSPTQDPVVVALQRHCLEPDGWRVFAHEIWSGGTARSWKSLVPLREANGPTDPAIAFLVVGVAEVPALGFCAPYSGDIPPEAATASAWRLEGVAGFEPDGSGGAPSTKPTAGPLTAVEVDLVPALDELGGHLGALWRPPLSAELRPDRWPTGRYVFALRAGRYERWWGVDVLPPRAEAPASATPVVVPAP